jgi:hypothetical protein
MIIWFCILIPIIAIGVLYWKFHKNVAWWEGGSMLLVAILLIWGTKSCSTMTQTRDVEMLSDYIVKVEHHHYWNEWIHETCTEEYACGTDKDGNTEYCTRTYDCSYEEEYYPYTKVTTSTGKTFTFKEGRRPHGGGEPKYYNYLMRKFATTPKFERDHRRDINTNYGKGYWGEIYSFRWKGETERIEYTVWSHTYENRVQASNSIENFPEVDTTKKRMYGLYDYPKIYSTYKCKSIIGENNPLDEYVNQKNSLIASKKQLKVFYLIYKNQPLDAGHLQQQYWKGGNKNEANICIGINDRREIQWVYVFSWSKNEMFKVEIRNFIQDKKFLDQKTFKEIVDYTHSNLEKNFVRREFAEFSYLTVEPPTWGIVTAFILTLLFCIGASIWIVVNEHDVDGNRYSKRWR